MAENHTDTNNQILTEIRENIAALVSRDSALGKSLWQALLEEHPADIAGLLMDIDREAAKIIYLDLPKKLAQEVFEELSNQTRLYFLSFMDESDKVEALNSLYADDLTDLFELCSDEDLKKYLNLLHARSRQKVLSLLKFPAESAGGIMESDVFTLRDDFTVEKSIHLLQRLKPSRDIHQQIYVTDKGNHLEGHINLEDLVLRNPKERIADFMHEHDLIAFVDEDRESIAKRMVHYNLMTVPVVDKEFHFLGVIPSQTLVDVLMEEASEDVQRMAALPPLKYPYFETSFWRMFFERSYILVALLLVESFSGFILRAYDVVLGTFLLTFVPMLTNTGGCTSSQTSAIVIQGMASGDIRRSNMFKFLRREFLMALVLGLLLGTVAFMRVYFTSYSLIKSIAVSVTICATVVAASTLGSTLPWILKRFNLDPAFSAGPFLATLMDILGVLIFCLVARAFLG